MGIESNFINLFTFKRASLVFGLKNAGFKN